MTNKSKAIAFKYLKAPVSAIVTRRNDYSLEKGGDELLVASGGGSSKTGVLNSIVRKSVTEYLRKNHVVYTVFKKYLCTYFFVR